MFFRQILIGEAACLLLLIIVYLLSKIRSKGGEDGHSYIEIKYVGNF